MSTEAVRPATSSTLAHAVVRSDADATAGEDVDGRGLDERGGAVPTTVIHGFAQNRRCLGPMLDELVGAGTVYAVDAPGHGGSEVHADADLWAAADLLVATCPPMHLIGYSMGARLALHAALRAPERVRSLVLIGGTAGIDDADERAARRDGDELLARRLETDGLDAFLEAWLELPMFAGLPEWARFDEERRTNTAEGLAASLRRAGTGSMQPLWDQLGRIEVPVLCITGAEDTRYGEFAQRLVSSVGGPATHVVIDGAGHAAHLERPGPTAAAILDARAGSTS